MTLPGFLAGAIWVILLRDAWENRKDFYGYWCFGCWAWLTYCIAAGAVG